VREQPSRVIFESRLFRLGEFHLLAGESVKRGSAAVSGS